MRPPVRRSFLWVCREKDDGSDWPLASACFKLAIFLLVLSLALQIARVVIS